MRRLTTSVVQMVDVTGIGSSRCGAASMTSPQREDLRLGESLCLLRLVLGVGEDSPAVQIGKLGELVCCA